MSGGRLTFGHALDAASNTTTNPKVTAMRKAGKRQTEGEWMRPAHAARALGVPRSTLTYRILRGDYKTRVAHDITLVWVGPTVTSAKWSPASESRCMSSSR